MGQILSQPITTKDSDEGYDDRLAYGISSMQGWRVTMEDAHTVVLDVGKLNKTKNTDKVSLFGVFDGHGGARVAQYTGDHLHEIVARQKAYQEKNYAQALIDGFLSTDRQILQNPSFDKDFSGCTATTTIITDDKVIAANAGDSRTVLGVKGQAKALSFDHKPQNEGERARIKAAGGFVEMGRVNGNLALSRAIGDFDFKRTASLPPEEQVVTACPDIIEHEFTPDDEFVVLACDGIWDCMNSQAVVKFIRRGIAEKISLQEICERLIDECLAPYSDISGIGCDNMTVMIVALLQGQTREEWYQTIADRVKNGDGPVAPAYYYTKSNEHDKGREAANGIQAGESRSGILFQQGAGRGPGSGQGGEGLVFDRNIIQRLLSTPIEEGEQIKVELPAGFTGADLPSVIDISEGARDEDSEKPSIIDVSDESAEIEDADKHEESEHHGKE